MPTTPVVEKPTQEQQPALRNVLDDVIVEEPEAPPELKEHRASRIALLIAAGAAMVAGALLSAEWLAGLFRAP